MKRWQFAMIACGLAWHCCLGSLVGKLDGAQEEDPNDLSKPLGHSFHGEAFNEGPRQAAQLISGVGKVDFKASTKSPLAARFINQGLAQFHGFWFWESERSFRQAATIDPECAIAYWGMAISNKENDERARGFLEQALQYQDRASKREQLYIQAWAKFLAVELNNEKDGDKEKESAKSKDKSKDGGKGQSKTKRTKDARTEADKARDLIRDLEKLSLDFPDDIEAKALICFRLWESEHENLKITSRMAVDALIGEVLALEPMHPAHHYRIHLWDGTKGEKALESAAKCGPAAPAIAHMWHMPGHTYSELKRYHDAVYQQEASARVDHAHMIRYRLLPDQIHNFAHNNEWLIRNLIAIGRVDDAIALACNMISLPRHTKFNKPDGRGSNSFGRERLLEVLSKYRLWERALGLEDSVLLDPEKSVNARLDRLQLLGSAAYALGKNEKAKHWHDMLSEDLKEAQEKVDRLEEVPPSTADREPTSEPQKTALQNYKKQEEDRKKKLEEAKNHLKKVKRAHALVSAHSLAQQKQWAEALKKLEESESRDAGLKAEWQIEAGELDKAKETAEKNVKDHRQEILPLAVATYVNWKAQDQTKAKEYFELLRQLAFDANLETPMLERLLPLAKELGWETRWTVRPEPSKDIGERPALDLLGPFRWEPYSAEDWVLEDGVGNINALKKYRGKPVIVVFYLGFGCLHCIEQLQAFEKAAPSIRNQGFELVAISTESIASLKTGMAKYDKPITIPLHADPQQQVFRAYRCFDDFEQMPLHGTFVIDPTGKVLWQDIGYEPFMDVDFVVQEGKRQLRLSNELREPSSK